MTQNDDTLSLRQDSFTTVLSGFPDYADLGSQEVRAAGTEEPQQLASPIVGKLLSYPVLEREQLHLNIFPWWSSRT